MELTIQTDKMEQFKENLAKLSKKLKSSFSYDVLSEVKYMIPVISQISEEESITTNVPVWYSTISVPGLDNYQYSINGFEFYAEVKHREGMDYIFSKDNEAFKKVSLDKVFKCHHCNKTISNRKNKIYMKKDGEFFMFGSDCITEYFGNTYMELAKNCRFISDFFNFGYTGEPEADTVNQFKNFITKANFCYHLGLNYDMVKGNCGLFDDLVKMGEWFNVPDFVNKYYHFSSLPTNVKMVDDIWEFWENIDPINNFENQVRQMYRIHKIVGGMLTWSVYKYNWNHEAKKEASKPWKYLAGEVGDEIKNLELTLDSISFFQGQYGYVYFHRFKTDNNEIVVSKNTYRLHDDDASSTKNIGIKFRITKCKISKKEAYKDIPQTYIKVTRQTNFQKV